MRFRPTRRRRGIILLVVLVMLTLFAIAGLTFVLYAEAASESARFNRDSETFTVSNSPDMDPSAALNIFLGQLIYGVPDPTAANANGGFSALRGHSLAETIYGSYDSLGAVPSDVPYNGTGRLSEPNLFAGTDGNQMVNYTYFASDGFLRDPSRPGARANSAAARTTYTGGQNPPYTYPDLNSMFLASINPATGQVVMPSYLRPWLFGSGNPANPNWTNAQGKYLTLRPRPAEMGPTFPMPDPATGCDVKNLSGLPGGNDSIWIDVGAPELYTASGLRYKMLVAPLILDLDSKINVNVVGNIFAAAQANRHAGNQGWGQWEVNMSRVLNNGTAPNEWTNLFLGNGGVAGRYGALGRPSNVFALSGPVPHAYAPADLNGVIDPGNGGAFTTAALQQWSVPAGVSCFPNFPSQTYGNGGALETQNGAGQPAHPMFFNPMSPTNPNRLLPLWSHATLLYAGPAASPNSDLVQLSKNNFSNPADPTGTLRRIYETTLLSMDLDRPGATPYFYDPNNANYTVAYNPAAGQAGYAYTGAAQPMQLAQRGTTPANSEFDPRTWRSMLPAVLTRMDLDKQLAPYPAGGAQPPDRQQFASDLFTRLLAVTGMTGVNANIAAASPQQYATLRWLAQLSANIVDFIDTDDVMTVFQWTTTPQPNDTGYVFGVELPKLVVNEVYLEYDNDSADPGMVNNPNPPPAMIQGATKPYHMNVWTELVNPLPSGADLNGPNNANLVNGSGTPLYQLVITQPNQGLRNADNTVGNPDGPTPPNAPYATQPYAPTGDSSVAGQVLAVVNNWGAVANVTPVGSTASSPPGPGSNQGYLLIGPPNPAGPLPAAAQIQLQPSVTAANMTYKVANNLGDTPPTPPTVLLQRLANPLAPFNPTTNPYVTVDYIDTSRIANPNGAGWYPVVNDARPYYAKGNNPHFQPNPNARFSFGRQEPYAAVVDPNNPAVSQWKQQAGVPANANQPTTTFFAVNNPPVSPTNHWLTHLDRPVVSPTELAHVSAFKPHELTQQFIDATGAPYGQYAPWLDQRSNLYRLFEFVKMKNPTPGIVHGGRIPGRVNLNTIDPNAKEVFEALCDAEPGNNFSNADVDQVFQTLMAQRTPGGAPGANDQPFWGMAQGASAGGDAMGATPRGIAQTLLAQNVVNPAGAWTKFASGPGQPAMTPDSLAGGHPYQQLELLNKLYNNTTTRSNVFAVWLTVGFFQITDDATQPMKLGPEINLAQGKNIRHHMFAIVDRTQLTTFTTKVGAGGVAAGNGVGINVPNPIADARTGLTWTIQAGTMLVYDPGLATEETVVVQGGNTANFTLGHAAGAAVVSRGNPGPWIKYDVTQDVPSGVVPYWVIID